jgi:hypothetical protein
MTTAPKLRVPGLPDGGAGFARAFASVPLGALVRLESARAMAGCDRKKGVRGGNMVSPAIR